MIAGWKAFWFLQEFAFQNYVINEFHSPSIDMKHFDIIYPREFGVIESRGAILGKVAKFPRVNHSTFAQSKGDLCGLHFCAPEKYTIFPLANVPCECTVRAGHVKVGECSSFHL